MINFKRFFEEEVMSPRASSGKHDYESAVVKTWKYFADTHGGRAPDVNEMHAELRASKTNPSHPLHINNATPKEFAKGVTPTTAQTEFERFRAKDSYDKNMNDAVDFVATAAQHPDLKPAWKNNFDVENTGKKLYPLSRHAQNSGLKNGTPSATGRGDIIFHNPHNPKKSVRLSLKRQKGYQIFSAGPAAFHSLYSSVANKMNLQGRLSNSEHAEAIEKIGKIRNHLQNNNRRLAQTSLFHLHNKMGPEFMSLIHEHGLSGEGHFADAEGTATHIGTFGSKPMISRIKDFVKSRMGTGGGVGLTEPEVGGAKGLGRSLVVRNRQR